MKTQVIRATVAGGVVCLASWLALAASAGNVGLQRAISSGAQSLLESPAAVIVVAVIAAGAAFWVTWTLRTSAALVLVGVLVGDLLTGLVLGPLAIGELEPIHAPLVFAAVSVLGVQPGAAFLGAWAAASARRRQNGA